jgi:outer membrane protein OmpA-like peptidoglycan-associated protein
MSVRAAARILLAVLGIVPAGLLSGPSEPHAQVSLPLHREPIPLVVGLTLTAAVETSNGDYETNLNIRRVNDAEVHAVWTAPGSSRWRMVRREDLKSSRFFLMRFGQRYPQRIPGSSPFGASSMVLTELKQRGTSEFACCFVATFEGEHPTGRISVVTKNSVTVPVIVNDRAVLLPAIHAKGTLGERDTEFYFLDEAANPIGLRWKVGNRRGRTDEQGRTEQTGQIVKISIPEVTSSKRIERALEASGRVDIYGIYFDFASATITADSEPVLREIADVLKRHTMWHLRVEGHTDNIGGDVANVDLSQRRANAVKEALVTRHRIAAGRLETAGFGARRPKDTNATLEGRARNRRVELIRNVPRQ